MTVTIKFLRRSAILVMQIYLRVSSHGSLNEVYLGLVMRIGLEQRLAWRILGTDKVMCLPVYKYASTLQEVKVSRDG